MVRESSDDDPWVVWGWLGGGIGWLGGGLVVAHCWLGGG
jgi:hypothetical protein